MAKKEEFGIDKAKAKLEKYCAYQERCHQEVRMKLISYKIYGDDLEEIITALIQDNFLNEERFAKAYARGKYKIKKWGRHKIEQALKQKQISAYCIRKGMAEIEDDVYIDNLKYWIKRKNSDYESLLPFPRYQKIRSFLFNKGYEMQLIQKYLEDVN